MGRLGDGLRDFPVIRRVRRQAFDRQFENNTGDNLFRGVFDSFDAALASAPATRPTGYDNPASAGMYVRRLRIDQHDYPAMFWMSRSLNEGMRRVVDLGGSVGIKYFAFGKFVDFPPDLLWRVIDVPAAVELGREFAMGRGASTALEFSHDMADADAMDVFFASGALQYLPQPLADILNGFHKKPRRIIVNTTPIHPAHSFFTLNSIGTAYCAYRVQSREAFVESIKAQGYRLRDEWQNTGKEMPLPFEQGYGLAHYSGFCFDRV
jgi:putative methyltransferase (TIGR04325 family)